jgi:hypothetical protein
MARAISAIFVGGPLHGRVQAVPDDIRIVRVPVTKECSSSWYTGEGIAEAVTLSTVYYHRRLYYRSSEKIPRVSFSVDGARGEMLELALRTGDGDPALRLI